jgi:type IV pilus assembly protein PilC
MPMYSYVAKDGEGKTKKELVEALNEQALADRLQNEGFFIISIQPASTAVSRPKANASTVKKFSHNKVKLEDLLILARQLATMLDSGVTLMRSLAVVSEQIESKELHRIILEVKAEVEEGRTLSSSLAKHPKVFNQFWVSLVEVGEASGTMPMVLNKLTVYSEQEAAFRSIVSGALVYPSVLFLVCMGAVCFFALFVAPRFESIFETMHTEIPFITTALMATFKFVKANFLFIIGGMFGVYVLIKNYFKTYQGKVVFEKIMFNMPLFGEIYKLVVVEKFSSQMAILVDSGVPILYALEITEKLVDNITCALVVSNIREAVREGKLLAEPMLTSGFFPPMAVQMIKVGEETGQLGQMLKHVANFYQKNVESFMKKIGTLIEPIMLVFMGGIIGTIVLAMFLPLFNITG